MRYLLTFVLGAVVGAVALYLILPEARLTRPQEQTAAVTQPLPASSPAPASQPPPAPPAVAKTEEQLLAERVGMEISPVNVASEVAIAAEPPLKVIPPLQPPANLDSESIVIPVVGVKRSQLRNMFHERRGSREHRAIDIAAPRGTPIVAAIDGPVGKLFLSKPGGITLYQYDPTKSWIYYYAHLDAYAPGIVEGKQLKRGDVIGFVGTTGNAPPNAPHLHFSIEKLTEPGRWWKSDAIDPFPLLSTRGVTIEKQ